MGRKYVHCKIEKEIAIIEMANEKKRNALSYDLLLELKRAFQAVEANDAIRAVVISGKGPSFCSGMDIGLLLKEDSMSMRKTHRRIQEVFSYLEHYSKPVIGAVHGVTVGAGLVLALICDLRIGSLDVVLGLPEIRRGIPLFLAAPKTIQRYLGIGKIKELCFTGRLVKAQEALELGFINWVVEKKDLVKEATRLAHEISMFNPVALAMLKGVLSAGYEMSQKSLLTLELDGLGFFWGTEEGKEGLRSFLQEREPTFHRK